MSEKVQIHQFDPVIYPVKLWVGINPTFEQVSEMFYGLNSEIERIDIDREQFNMDHFVVARTHTVASKKDGWIGIYVGINKPKMLTTKFICHESVHCADFICEQFGIMSRKFDEGEPYAYLVGWIAECIEKVKLNKL